MSLNSELIKILEITRDVMDVTITEEDLESVSIEDAPSIARTCSFIVSCIEIVGSHCTDETTQSLYLQLLKNLLDLPAEGTLGHDLWSPLVEFSENLVSVSSQWNERNLGLTVFLMNRYDVDAEEEEK